MSPASELPGYLESYLSQQAEAAAPTASEAPRPGEWRSLWTWIELVDGEVLPASLEILGRTREIADELGTRTSALLFGRDVTDAAARLGEYGADQVFVADADDLADFALDPARELLVHVVRENRPEAVIFPATVQGRNLGGQLAAAARTGIIPNCNGLTLEATERLIVGHQTSFEERLLSQVVCTVDRPQIFTVTPGSFRRPVPDRGRRAQVIPITSPAKTPNRVRVVSREPDRPKSLPQFDAVVAAGLGVGSKEGFDLARRLADELQAYAGATRGAIACGWADPEWLISATRHRLQPQLYVGTGVVGEYDHLRAIEDATFVIALTEDSSAPIAENADLVGLGPPLDVLRRLVDGIRTAKTDRFLVGRALPQ